MTPRYAAVARVAPAERWVAELGVVAVLLLWWAWSQRLPAFVLPSPAEVGLRMLSLASDLEFLRNVLLSLFRVATAVLIAMLVGVVFALLPYYKPVAQRIVDRVLLPFFNSFPSLGWVLLVTIWFGVSELSVLLIQVAILLPFCIINLSEGVRVLDHEALEMAHSLTRSRWSAFRLVLLPLLVPYSIGALRICYGVAWKIALLAELYGARDGLGYLMLQAQIAADSAAMLAVCLFIVIVFTVGDQMVIRRLAARFGEVQV